MAEWQRPAPFAILLAVAGIALFLSLANWQFRRAREKDDLFAAYAAASSQAAVSLAQARRDASSARYPSVRVSGRFDAARSYLLDNQVRHGGTGVMVFGVFVPDEGGAALLVNRGFLARQPDGTLPPVPPVPAQAVELRALYAPPPGAGLRMGGNALPAQDRWPKTVIYVDLDEVAADAGRPLDARVLLQLGDDGGALVREWTPAVFPAARHRAYAFTWLTFAGAVVAAFLILHRRRDPDPT